MLKCGCAGSTGAPGSWELCGRGGEGPAESVELLNAEQERILSLTNAQGSAERPSLSKIDSTLRCSSPRKSLVKGERLVRYEEKPE